MKALVPEGASAATVLKTTKRFMEAYEAGLTPEEQIGYALGVPTDKLSEAAEEVRAVGSGEVERKRHAVERRVVSGDEFVRSWDSGV